MKITIQLFAGLSEVLGQRQVTLEVADGATVAELRQRLSQDYPAVMPYLPTVIWAVNEEYVEADQKIGVEDEVALIPPVSGGVGDSELIEVTAEPLETRPLYEAVRKDEGGAVIMFHGVARNESDGRRVLALEYEAYPAMAERKLRDVADEVRARWPVTGIGILHRTGRLQIGETSLLVAVSAPHRKEAFEACQYAVDRVKETVPVWKKEIWEDGDGAWVTGHAVETPHLTPASPEA